MLGVVVSIAALIALGMAKPRSTSDLLSEDYKSTTEKIEQVSTEVKNLDLRLKALTNIPPENAIGQELSGLKVEQSTTDKRLKTLEHAISDNPERALSVPLLRKDMEALQLRISSIQEATHDDVERLYTVMLWVLGSVVTVALTAFGLGLAHIRKNNPKAEAVEDS